MTIPVESPEFLREEFRRTYGRDINEPAPQVLHNVGNPDCKHDRVFYDDERLMGQYLWCDLPNCGRHESMAYSPNHKMKFPPGALISTPNQQYGGENFYSFKANEQGIAGLLPKDQWIGRERRIYYEISDKIKITVA